MDAALSSLLPQFDLLMPEGHLMPDAPILRMVRAHFMQVRSSSCAGRGNFAAAAPSCCSVGLYNWLEEDTCDWLIPGACRVVPVLECVHIS